MIASDPNPPDHAGAPDGGDRAGPPDQPVTTLRGASVDVDIRRTGRVVAWFCAVVLVVLGTVLLVSGLHTNDQINQLHHDGVPVRVTVTACTGLMGGTGGQEAGYACRGNYTLDGTTYHQSIPGMTFHPIGSTIEGVAVPGNPKLLSTPDQVARQKASARVFLIPGLLFLVAVVTVVLLLRSRRRPAAVAAGTGVGDAR